jgi:hypothetical protein
VGGGNLARVKGGSDLNPSWSPDGGTIVYSSIRYEDWGIFAVPARGGAEWALVPAGSSLGYVDDPIFSPDGRPVGVRPLEHLQELGGSRWPKCSDDSFPQVIHSPGIVGRHGPRQHDHVDVMPAPRRST